MQPWLLEYNEGLPCLLALPGREIRAHVTRRSVGESVQDMRSQGYIEIENWSDFGDRDLWVKKTSLR